MVLKAMICTSNNCRALGEYIVPAVDAQTTLGATWLWEEARVGPGPGTGRQAHQPHRAQAGPFYKGLSWGMTWIEQDLPLVGAGRAGPRLVGPCSGVVSGPHRFLSDM